MCILKNPNSDVKDKEVPEHRFCNCGPSGFCEFSHPKTRVIAVGKFIYLGDGKQFDLCEACFMACPSAYKRIL